MSSAQLRRDLGRDLQQSIGELLQRKIKVASAALEASDLAMILIEASVSVCLTTAATVANHCEPELQAEIFDLTLAGIHRNATGDRERSLAAVANARVSA